jgi:hypothetical protein
MKTEQQLDDAIARLNPQIEPATDLWPAIAAQLTVQPAPQQVSLLPPPVSTQQPVYRPWWASAAAVLFAVALWQQWPNRQADIEPTGGQIVTTAAVTGGMVGGLAQSQQQIRLAEKLQLMQLQQIPAGFTNWQQQLAVWQQASEQVTQALAADPNNLKLIRKFNRLQQQQLNYIRKLVDTSQLS